MKSKFWFRIMMFTTAICSSLSGQSMFEYDARPINGGARIAAMGGGASGESYEANSMYWNPASISFIRRPSFVVSSILGWNNQTFDNTVSLPPVALDNAQSVSIGIAGSYFGKQWSQPYFAYNGIDVGYAIKFDPTVSVGVLTNFRYGSTLHQGIFSAMSSIGGFYSPSPGISYGVVFDGIGMGNIFQHDEKVTSLRYNRKLDKSIRIGTAFRFPSIYRAPFMSISMESQKVLSHSGIAYRAGIEMFPLAVMSLRCGIITKRTGTAGTFGIGFVMEKFQFDYAASPSRAIERFHQISLSYHIGD